MSNVLGQNKNYILLNNFGSKHILVMKFAQFMWYYKGKILFENYWKNLAWELVPDAFYFWRILYKKELQEVCMLVLTFFDYYISKVHGIGPNWYQVGNKTFYITRVSKCYIENGYLCYQAWKCHLWHVSVYLTDQTIMQRENPMELNFEGLLNFEMQKVNVTTDRAQLVAEKNGAICLLVMFTLRVMVMKMSKVFQFLYFVLMA